MSKTDFRQVAKWLVSSLEVSSRAQKLYADDGNPADLWHAEDEITRLYYLRLAAQTEETKSPAL